MQNSLDLFTPPVRDVAYESAEWVEAKPISSLDHGIITIVRKGDSDHFVDMSLSWMQVTCKITKPDGSKLDAGTKVATVNLPLHSMFEQIDVELNGSNISASMNTYPFRAYMETLLTYGADAKQTWLSAAGYHSDERVIPEPNAKDVEQPQVFKNLIETFKGGEDVQFAGPMHLDLTHQGRLIIPQVDITLRFVRSRDDFILLQATDETEQYKFVLSDMKVWFYQVRVVNSVRVELEKQLLKQPAVYPMTRVEVKTFTIGSGGTTHEEDNLVLGRIPRRIVLGLVSNKAMTGDRHKSPFYFQDFNITNLRLLANGSEVPYGALSLQPNTTRAFTSLDGYVSMLLGTGKFFGDVGNTIAYNEWLLAGKTFFAFDLTPHRSAECFTMPRHGNIRLTMKFKEAIPETINLIVYTEYDSEVKIDKNRQIITDF